MLVDSSRAEDTLSEILIFLISGNIFCHSFSHEVDYFGDIYEYI
jgi:hypothetical protein